MKVMNAEDSVDEGIASGGSTRSDTAVVTPGAVTRRGIASLGGSPLQKESSVDSSSEGQSEAPSSESPIISKKNNIT